MKALLYGVAAAGIAYVTRLVGPKIRKGDIKLVTVANAGFGSQLSPIVGQAPFFLYEVTQVSQEGYYGRIVGVGVPTGAGTDLVQVTRTTPFPAAPQQMGPISEAAFAANRWQT